MRIGLHGSIKAIATCVMPALMVSCSPDTPPEVSLVSSLPSPDGRWEARLEEVVYQIAPIGGASPVLELHIVPKGTSISYVDDDPTEAAGHGDPAWDEPASKYFVLHWKDASHLIVQCGQWDDTKGTKQQISGVSIEYRKMPPTK